MLIAIIGAGNVGGALGRVRLKRGHDVRFGVRNPADEKYRQLPRARLMPPVVRDVGFEAVDAGPLRIARLLEPLAMLRIDQALNRGAGVDFAFAIVRKK